MIEPAMIETPDLRTTLLEDLKQLIPSAFSEGQLNVEALQQLLGQDPPAPERYFLNWVGRDSALRRLQKPSNKTLVPDLDASVNWEHTNNAIVQADNFDALQLLLTPYQNRLRIVYIDPPYNTGKDFVYNDDFREERGTYERTSGQRDEYGNRLSSKVSDTDGHKHSKWLSFMLARLHLAQKLLGDDGIILISIDDHEVHNLRLLMNEVFGEENFIAQLIWEKGRKNDARLFSVGHEYMLVYAKRLAHLKEQKTIWRQPKPGAQELWDEYVQQRKRHGDDDAAVETGLKGWFAVLPADHSTRKLKRYLHIDKYGPWRDRDISWPGGGGPRYDVPHDRTGLPCKVPERGWGFAKAEDMKARIELGLVVFRDDETEPPFLKAHLRPVAEELLDGAEDDAGDEGLEEGDAELATQVRSSYIYKQSQSSVRHLRDLLGEKVFNNPKDHEVLAELFKYVTTGDHQGIVLDFFAGSGSTAEAVLEVNRVTGGNLRFILVQWDEETPATSVARREGYATIAAITRARVRKAGERFQRALGASFDGGFRAFRGETSFFRPQAPVGTPPAEDQDILKLLELHVDRLVDGWTPEGVIAEVALKEARFRLNYRTRVFIEKPNTVFEVTNPDLDQRMFVCLDDTLDIDTARSLPLTPETLFVVRDRALSDATAATLVSLCRLRTL